MKLKIYLLLVIGFFSFNLSANSEFFPNEEQKNNILLKKIKYKEQELSYFIYIPSNKKLKKIDKLIDNTTMYFIFHGETSKSEDFLNKTDLHSKIIADGNSFISFNSSANDWFSQERKNIKDNDFILNLINYTQQYVFGIFGYKDFKVIAYSSGASLVNKFICEDSIKNISKYILINGSMKEDWLNNCNPLKEKNIVLVNSTKDDYYTYDDLSFKNEKYKMADEDFLTINDYSDKMRIKLNCSSDPVISEIDNTLEDSSLVNYELYSCINKNKLEIYNLVDAGHNMPNTKNYSLEDFRGIENKDIYIYNIINN